MLVIHGPKPSRKCYANSVTRSTESRPAIEAPAAREMGVEGATAPVRYPEIEVRGTPLEMGKQIGEAARQRIRGFSEIALERVNKTVNVSSEKAMDVARGCLDCVASYRPDLLEELEGMAAGSGVDTAELMLLQIRNQLQAEGACTSFSVAGVNAPNAASWVGQNWDNDPALDPFTVVLTRRPSDKPAFLRVTQAGLIAYIGFNEHGLGVCLNTLPAPSREVGIPLYFLVRAVYEARCLQEAVEAVGRQPRALPANLMLSTPQGPADLEITLGDVHVLSDEGADCITHTNHCLHPDLLAINRQFPELIQSYPRETRVDRCFLQARGSLSLERLKAVLRDHDNYPRSICRHTNQDSSNGFWQTVFSVIMAPQAGEMHLARGTPCDRSYHLYRLC